MALSHPQTLAGRYRIVEPIGEGNFSITYRATDAVLGRDVAIKILRDQYVAHTGFAVRFEKEARAAARINHPNVVQVFDFGRDERTAYIVMQYVRGRSLKDYIREEAPLAVEESTILSRQILEGLAAIHDAGIIHRDVKPQNVLLTPDGQAKLTDFGIARLASDAAGLTETGTALGTAAYMAPEQASGREIGPWTDVYAVGVILFEMLTGQLPFPGDNPVQVMYRHVNETPPLPQSLNPSIPPTIESIILRSLTKDPQERYPSARAMRDALLSPGMENAYVIRRPPRTDPTVETAVAPVIAGAPPRVPPGGHRPTARRGGNPWYWALPLIVVLAALLLIAAIALAGGSDGDDDVPAVIGEATETAEPVVTEEPTATATPTLEPTATPTATPTSTPVPPTATPSPSPSPSPTPSPTPTPIPPTATPVPPTPTPEPEPTEPPAAPTVALDQPLQLPAVPDALLQGESATLEAGDFEGAYRREDGQLYGLPATHIYGQGSGADAATAAFELPATPEESAVVVITGLDDELNGRVPLRLLVNDVVVWEGLSPFQNAGTDIESAEWWSDVAWVLSDPSILQEGVNTVTLQNLAEEGEIGAPPWQLITSAVVYYQ